MIINQIPTKIRIEVIDEESESGIKKIETEVICVCPMLSNISGVENDVMVFVSMDKTGRVHGRPIDAVEIIETRKYEETQNWSTRSTSTKNSGRRRKSHKVRDNNSRDKGGDESKRNSREDGNRSSEQADGSQDR
jgi:hypothetical protein